MNPCGCSFIVTICIVYRICQYKIGLRDDLNVLQVFVTKAFIKSKLPCFCDIVFTDEAQLKIDWLIICTISIYEQMRLFH
jgi:hypothetical protein